MNFISKLPLVSQVILCIWVFILIYILLLTIIWRHFACKNKISVLNKLTVFIYFLPHTLKLAAFVLWVFGVSLVMFFTL